MNHSLNSLHGDCKGTIYGSIMGVIKGDTRSLDCGSYGSPYHEVTRNTVWVAWHSCGLAQSSKNYQVPDALTTTPNQTVNPKPQTLNPKPHGFGAGNLIRRHTREEKAL